MALSVAEQNILPEVRAAIIARLSEIEHSEQVRILFAIESGSRAWGFPSPDSDYDVRFVYVHRADWYLSIEARRNVIELPIAGDLDISGWDLKKALQLLVKSNAVLLEWLHSPIVYRADDLAMENMVRLGERTAHLRPSTYHYLRLAETQYRRFIAGRISVGLKKYFYSLRPVLALMWMRVHPEKPVPMDLPTLRAGIILPEAISDFLDELLRRKAKTKELGEGPRVSGLDQLIEHEIRLAPDSLPELPSTADDLLDEANALFRDLVRS